MLTYILSHLVRSPKDPFGERICSGFSLFL